MAKETQEGGWRRVDEHYGHKINRLIGTNMPQSETRPLDDFTDFEIEAAWDMAVRDQEKIEHALQSTPLGREWHEQRQWVKRVQDEALHRPQNLHALAVPLPVDGDTSAPITQVYLADCGKCNARTIAWVRSYYGWGYLPIGRCGNPDKCGDKQPIGDVTQPRHIQTVSTNQRHWQ